MKIKLIKKITVTVIYDCGVVRPPEKTTFDSYYAAYRLSNLCIFWLTEQNLITLVSRAAV